MYLSVSAPRRGADEPVRLLVIAQTESDLRRVRAVGTENGWEIFEAKNNVAALASIISRQVGVVLVEHDVVTGQWAKLVSELQHNAGAAPIVLFSRWSDERLLADVLSRGG